MSLSDIPLPDRPRLERAPALASSSPLSIVRWLLLAAAAVLFALHFLHLAADFPNHSPWMDWAKYTDEGWYGDAAVRHFDLGHWYVRGDFNPAAALPVWPLLEALLFRFTGVGVVPARALTVAVFGFILLCAYLFLRRAVPVRRGAAVAPAAAVLLLAASPFCYAFMRMAILEPLLILLTLLCLLVAAAFSPHAASPWQRLLPPLTLGLLLPLLLLTKTTGLFLLPAIAWMVAARCGFELRSLFKLGGLTALLALGLWLLYFNLLVRPHYLDDYRYLFSANAYTGITAATAFAVLRNTLRDGQWIGFLLYPLTLLALLATLLWSRLRGNPFAVSLLLWALGYAAFLAYHNNLQPRYYLVIAIPLTMLLALMLDVTWQSGYRAPAAAMAAALLVVAVRDTRSTLSYVRSPEYTFVAAAQKIQQIVAANPTHRNLLLSISGSDLSLMTGLPSICDDFGTLELEARVALYRPGWYLSWNQVDDDKMDALTPLFHLERVASFPALDDPDRNLLILYRLDPADRYRPPSHRLRRPLPKRLISKLGQQPSASQLQH